MVRGGALVLVASLLLSGCGESAPEPVPIVAGVAELQGPYQTQPYSAFDENLIRSVDGECADSLRGAFNVQPEPDLADGRGGGRILLIYGAGAADTAECFAKIKPDGTHFVDSTGASSGSEPVRLGPLEITTSSGGSASGEDSWSYLHGNVGSEIGGVVIGLADGTNITASLGGGRFAAWWPGEVQTTRILGFDRAGNQVANQPN